MVRSRCRRVREEKKGVTFGLGQRVNDARDHEGEHRDDSHDEQDDNGVSELVLGRQITVSNCAHRNQNKVPTSRTSDSRR